MGSLAFPGMHFSRRCHCCYGSHSASQCAIDKGESTSVTKEPVMLSNNGPRFDEHGLHRSSAVRSVAG